MIRFEVALGARSYPILIGEGLLGSAQHLLPCLAAPRAAIVTDSTVAPLYLALVAQGLRGAGVDAIEIVIPAGESNKDWQTLNLVFDRLLGAGCTRDTTLIALGGGVVGDLAGFAAATYQRGIPLLQIPTTLLAQVDSSVGGKTAINHPLGKNMIGAFYQPRLVLADSATLKTLPDRELRSGIAEVIKYALLGDAVFFAWLEGNIGALLARDADALMHAIRRCCEMKAAIVAQDEREAGLRARLNLGHTFGHAIEAGLGYGVWLHGEAVAAGTLMAAELSRRLGYIGAEEVTRVKQLLLRAGLPTAGPALGPDTYLEHMRRDKKVAAGTIRYVLLKSLGEAVIGTAPDAEVRQVLAACSDANHG